MGETGRFTGVYPKSARTGPLPNLVPEAIANPRGGPDALGLEMPGFWADMMGAESRDLMDGVFALMSGQTLPEAELPASFFAAPVSVQDVVADPVVGLQLLAAQDRSEPEIRAQVEETVSNWLQEGVSVQDLEDAPVLGEVLARAAEQAAPEVQEALATAVTEWAEAGLERAVARDDAAEPAEVVEAFKQEMAELATRTGLGESLEKAANEVGEKWLSEPRTSREKAPDKAPEKSQEKAPEPLARAEVASKSAESPPASQPTPEPGVAPPEAADGPSEAAEPTAEPAELEAPAPAASGEVPVGIATALSRPEPQATTPTEGPQVDQGPEGAETPAAEATVVPGGEIVPDPSVPSAAVADATSDATPDAAPDQETEDASVGPETAEEGEISTRSVQDPTETPPDLAAAEIDGQPADAAEAPEAADNEAVPDGEEAPDTTVSLDEPAVEAPEGSPETAEADREAEAEEAEAEEAEGGAEAEGVEESEEEDDPKKKSDKRVEANDYEERGEGSGSGQRRDGDRQEQAEDEPEAIPAVATGGDRLGLRLNPEPATLAEALLGPVVPTVSSPLIGTAGLIASRLAPGDSVFLAGGSTWSVSEQAVEAIWARAGQPAPADAPAAVAGTLELGRLPDGRLSLTVGVQIPASGHAHVTLTFDPEASAAVESLQAILGPVDTEAPLELAPDFDRVAAALDTYGTEAGWDKAFPTRRLAFDAARQTTTESVSVASEAYVDLTFQVERDAQGTIAGLATRRSVRRDQDDGAFDDVRQTLNAAGMGEVRRLMDDGMNVMKAFATVCRQPAWSVVEREAVHTDAFQIDRGLFQ